MANVQHFDVHADDVERARTFYASVFDWQFEDWGPPEFYRVRTGSANDPGVGGALQKRHEINGTRMTGYMCTIGVEDIDTTMKAVEQAGGKLVSEKYHIPTVGWLVHFVDTEGNLAGAMQYEAGHA
jgi:hypothetical protein